MISIGTLASQTAWLAAAVMAVMAFVVLFAGVISSVLASASTSLLLAFVLSVTTIGPVSSLPDRLAGGPGQRRSSGRRGCAVAGAAT